MAVRPRDRDGEGTEPFWPDPGRYAEVVARAARAGFQCATHAIGDRAVAAALDAYRDAGTHGLAPHRIEHLETMRDAELARLAAEGVAASMQPLHAEGLDEPGPFNWRERLQPAQVEAGFRWGDVRRSGAILALGSDWPVASFDPRPGLAWARLRRAPGRPEREPFLPGQRLSALEALEGYTSEAARIVGEAHLNGRIAPGLRADLTGLGADPVDCPADDLPACRCSSPSSTARSCTAPGSRLGFRDARDRHRDRGRGDPRARRRARAGPPRRAAAASSCSSARTGSPPTRPGHNSGVAHAGIYYAPGSLKARLCVAGVRELAEYCDERGVTYDRCGKVIVALDESELPGLEELQRRGEANGVPGLRRLDAHGLREIEPHAAGIAALHSPATAIVDFPGVAHALADDIRAAGGEIHCGAGVTGIEVRAGANGAGGRRVVLRHAGGAVEAGFAVFCAGAWSDRLARLAGADPDPRIVPFRGAYLRLAPERAGLVRGLIYPVPDPTLPFLGVHLTRHAGGDVLIGPTALLAPARDAYALTAVRRRDLGETLRWPGTWRLARRFWRTGMTELRHAASAAALDASGRALRARAPAGGHAPRVGRGAGAGAGARRQARRRLRLLAHRARAPRAQRAVAGRHGGAGHRPPRGGRGRAPRRLACPAPARASTAAGATSCSAPSPRSRPAPRSGPPPAATTAGTGRRRRTRSSRPRARRPSRRRRRPWTG